MGIGLNVARAILHGTRQCAAEINDVNKLVRDDPDPTYQPSPDDPDALDQFLRKRGVGDQSFTCLTIAKVATGFFEAWAANPSNMKKWEDSIAEMK